VGTKQLIYLFLPIQNLENQNLEQLYNLQKKNFRCHLVLMQTRLVAAGPIQQVFTLSNLQTAYGTDVSILSDMIHKLGQTPGNLSDHPKP
jgi:ABC-type cobalamin/Fe3+-siderophores transport system ATPase subunit